MIISVEINPDREEWGRRFGMTHVAHPIGAGDIVRSKVVLVDYGADPLFDAIGDTTVMRQVLEACHRGGAPPLRSA